MKLITKYFKKPSAIDMAKSELEKARCQFLENQTHAEYYAAQVEFEEKRIWRLQSYIESIEGAKKK